MNFSHARTQTTPAIAPSNAQTYGDTRSISVEYQNASGVIRQKDFVVPDLPVFDTLAAAFAPLVQFMTVDGPVCAADLRVGMRLPTMRGETRRITWIGRMSRAAASDSTIGARQQPLFRVSSDAFGLGRPDADILFGPAARRLSMNDTAQGEEPILMPFNALVDTEAVIEVAHAQPIELCHIMLDQHALISVNGIVVESFFPSRADLISLSPDLRALYLSLFPQVRNFAGFGHKTCRRCHHSSGADLTAA